MNRRKFLSALGATALGAHCFFDARAQPLKLPRVGVLLYGSPQDPQADNVLRGLRGLGYETGRNVIIDFRHADDNVARLPALAADLARLNPDVIMAATGDVDESAAREATRKIPIVFSISSDPVQLGLVESLARPGGNATGVTYLQDDLAAKRLQLFKEAAPKISRVAFLWNPGHLDNERREAERAAKIIGIELLPFETRNAAEIRSACMAAKDAWADALYVVSSGLMVVNIRMIVDFAAENRLPLIGGWGAWTSAGGLLSYGPNVVGMVRRSYGYADRILKGALPADLPVEQPTRFELHVNLKTANALGLTVSETFLLRADGVIE